MCCRYSALLVNVPEMGVCPVAVQVTFSASAAKNAEESPPSHFRNKSATNSLDDKELSMFVKESIVAAPTYVPRLSGAASGRGGSLGY